MRHKNFGTEAQLPPFHSKETTQKNSISQIMERVDKKNEYSQEIQKLESVTSQVAEMIEKAGKDKTEIRCTVDIMDQVSIMLSESCKELTETRKQVGNDIAKLAQTTVPFSLPDNVKEAIKKLFADCLNEMKKEMDGILYEYRQSLQKRNEEFVSEFSSKKGVWLSRKVFWWSAGIAYLLSLLGVIAIGLSMT